MEYTNEKYIPTPKRKLFTIIIVLIGIPYIIWSFRDIKSVDSVSDFIGYIFPLIMLFLLIRIIYLSIWIRKHYSEFGVSKFEIKEDSFFYKNKKEEIIFNVQNLPVLMKRNFESFIIENEKDKLKIMFKDFGLINEELESQKNDFDKLKNHLIKTSTNNLK